MAVLDNSQVIIKLAWEMKNVVSFLIMTEVLHRATGVLTSDMNTAVCQSSTANVDFNINLQGNTILTGSESWYFSFMKIANKFNGTFAPLSSYANRLSTYSTFGISLTNVTSTDAGKYMFVFIVSPEFQIVTATSSLTVYIAPTINCVLYYTLTGNTATCFINRTNNMCFSTAQTTWTNGTGTSSTITIVKSGNYTCCIYSTARSCYCGSYISCETFQIRGNCSPTTTNTISSTFPTIMPSIAENPRLPVAGIAGGISAGLVVIFIMGIGIVLWRRYQYKKQNEHVTGTDNDVSMEHEERPPENNSYEKLHAYVNSDIKMYSSVKIPKTSKDAEQKYENTWIERPDTTA